MNLERVQWEIQEDHIVVGENNLGPKQRLLFFYSIEFFIAFSMFSIYNKQENLCHNDTKQHYMVSF